MEVIAKVFDWEITKTELDFEEKIIKMHYPDASPSEISNFAIERIIDRYLFMKEALDRGFEISNEELEDSILDFIDTIDDPETSAFFNRPDRGKQLEIFLRSVILKEKLLDSLMDHINPPTDDQMYKFYLDRRDYFYKDEQVRVSQVFIKGRDENSKQLIDKIWNDLLKSNDFDKLNLHNYNCPCGLFCGDLGFFPKGRMISEIEEIAFDLLIDEVSKPFLSKLGYHIIKVTDKLKKQSIPFEQIKDYLKDSLLAIEEEMAESRILQEIRKKCQGNIKILINAVK